MNRRLSGSNGRLQPSMKSWKANEPLHGSNSVRTCRRKPFLLWICGFVAIGSVWFLLSFNSKCLMSKEKEEACEERTRILLHRYNVSRKQLPALASLFSGSDQVICTFCHSFIFLGFWLEIMVVEDNYFCLETSISWLLLYYTTSCWIITLI